MLVAWLNLAARVSELGKLIVHSLSIRRTIAEHFGALMLEDLESLDLVGEVRRDLHTFPHPSLEF